MRVSLTTWGSGGDVVPHTVDRPYWAAGVARLGIGAAHDGPTPTFDSLSTIRTGGTTVAAKMLLDTVSGERPPVPA